MAADKENLPVNSWVGREDALYERPTKHVAFRIEDGTPEECRPKVAKPTRSEYEGGAGCSQSNGNVTPGNQTSEILMEKMRELREKLDKLKQKNSRKSVDTSHDSSPTDGDDQHHAQPHTDTDEASVPSPKNESSASNNVKPSTSIKPMEAPGFQLQPSTQFQVPLAPTHNAQSANKASKAPVANVSTTTTCTAPSSSATGARTKPRIKLPTPLETVVSSKVTSRKKPRIPASLSQPAQRIPMEEARAQLEQQSILEVPAPEPTFRAPVIRGARDSAKDYRPDQEASSTNVQENKLQSYAENLVSENTTRKEKTRSREVSAPALRQADAQSIENCHKERTTNEVTQVETVNATYDTRPAPPGSTFTSGMSVGVESSVNETGVSDKMSFKSPPPPKRPRTPRRQEKEATDASTSTDTQKTNEIERSDRSRHDASASADAGHQNQNGISVDKLNLLSLAQQRGALEFLQTFASGETSFLAVNGRKYMKLNQIGRGGSSKVYRVVSPNWTTYALKYVPLKNADTVTEESYLNEISLLKKLNRHDNIIRLVDSEVRPGGIFLLLEYAELDLDKMLKTQQQRNKEILAAENGQPSPSNLLPSYLCLNSVRLFWQQMLEAVHTIHEERVVHGDLKPANFVCIRGRLKLIDFGIAKAISNDTTNIVRDNQIGTLNYISPEALIDTSPGHSTKFKLGRPSDIWSLGCILYQMVYGRSPFALLDNMIRKLQAITNSNYQIEYPLIDNPPLLDTMKLCLKFDPRQRPTIPELLQHPFLK